MSVKSYNTLFIGKVSLQFPVLESTNKYASDLLAKSKPTEGTVITASNQVAGVGQFGSSWSSEAGSNITLSIILYPSFLLVSNQFMFNKAIALGVYDFACSYLSPTKTKLKWPNDLYYEDKKVGGILIQNSLSGHKIRNSVVGIGLNINQTAFDSNLPNPFSFALATGQKFDLEVLRCHLCKMIELRYLQLREQKSYLISADYLAALYRFEVISDFITKDGRLFSGKIVGVEKNGRLKVVDLSDGVVCGFYFKEIRFG